MRGENDLQRIDRNFLELLQELRVAQTGVQILFAFMLGLAFTPRFATLGTTQQAVYLVTLVCAASSAALLIAPVSYHRTVFRRGLKAQLVEIGHRYALIGLVLLMLALVGGVELAAGLVLGDWAALLATALCTVLVTLWFLVPLRHRNRHGPHADCVDHDLGPGEDHERRSRPESTAGGREVRDDQPPSLREIPRVGARQASGRNSGRQAPLDE